MSLSRDIYRKPNFVPNLALNGPNFGLKIFGEYKNAISSLNIIEINQNVQYQINRMSLQVEIFDENLILGQCWANFGTNWSKFGPRNFSAIGPPIPARYHVCLS